MGREGRPGRYLLFTGASARITAAWRTRPPPAPRGFWLFPPKWHIIERVPLGRAAARGAPRRGRGGGRAGRPVRANHRGTILRILYAVCDQGLGHATRSAPLIDRLRPGNRLLILSAGSALTYLQTRFPPDGRISFLACPAYPPILRGWGSPLYPLRLAADAAAFQAALWREHTLTAELARTWRPDLIVSDARYGVGLSEVPSYLITHQLRILLPGFIRWAEGLALRDNVRRLARFRRILVPDHQGGILSGRLSRVEDQFPPGRLAFAGHLSALGQMAPASGDPFQSLSPEAARIARRPDILCLAGGYLLKQKQDFLAKARADLRRLGRPAVIARGDPAPPAVPPVAAPVAAAPVAPPVAAPPVARLLSPNLLEIPHAQGALLRELFIRARAIVGRSGYSTVMDLAEHPKPAYLVPTPGQFEQVYLARHLKESGYAHSSEQGRLDIAGWWESDPTSGWPRLYPTERNLSRFVNALGLG